MPSSFTSGLRLELQANAENDSTWGEIANTQFQLLEDSIRGINNIGVSTATDITLSAIDGASDQARRMVLKLTGTPTANINIIVPAVSKLYVVDGSGIAGSNTVTIKPLSGTGVAFSAGQRGVIICDGTNVSQIFRSDPQFPTGGIIMWSGTISTIPTGWFLCDGTNGTPDLRDRFIVGARQDNLSQSMTNLTGSLTKSGGSLTTTSNGGETLTTGGTSLTVAQIPPHTHPIGDGNGVLGISGSSNPFLYGGGSRNFQQFSTTGSTGTGDPHTHSVTTSSHTHTSTPPYFALAFIMKG